MTTPLRTDLTGATSSADLHHRLHNDVNGVANTLRKGLDRALAAALDPLIVGAITRDANGAATGAGVVWPDGSTGTYTATTVSTAHPGAVDAYTVTKVVGTVTTTFTQSAVTRDTNGAVTNRPAITES